MVMPPPFKPSDVLPFKAVKLLLERVAFSSPTSLIWPIEFGLLKIKFYRVTSLEAVLSLLVVASVVKF